MSTPPFLLLVLLQTQLPPPHNSPFYFVTLRVCWCQLSLILVPCDPCLVPVFLSKFAHTVHTKTNPPLHFEALPTTAYLLLESFLSLMVLASITLSLPDSDFLYTIEFLVCSNLLHPLECVLGWEFLTFYSLQLSILGEPYCLVGPNGCTPLKPLPFPANPQYQSYSASAIQVSREELPVFVQSHDYGPVFATIEKLYLHTS